MGFIFEPFAENRCCLCGSTDDLTGEHKVKAAALRSIFRGEAMAIGNLEGPQTLRIAQGPKSREFHFKAPLCGVCNSTKTQPADKEFDHFHAEAAGLLIAGQEPIAAFELDRYAVGSKPYLNLFRYFAKLMCCHLAESGGPRPLEISRFAIGESDRNTISLQIDLDPTYSDLEAAMGEHQYAAHGGLIVITDEKTQQVSGFLTSLTIGPVRYIASIHFGALVALAIKLFHRPFAGKCRAAYLSALDAPLSPDQRRKFGV